MKQTLIKWPSGKRHCVIHYSKKKRKKKLKKKNIERKTTVIIILSVPTKIHVPTIMTIIFYELLNAAFMLICRCDCGHQLTAALILVPQVTVLADVYACDAMTL